MKRVRTTQLCLALIVAALACSMAAAQDAVLLRYARAPGEAQVSEVSTRETGVAMGNIEQKVEADLTVLEIVRSVADGASTADEFTLAARILLTNNGTPVIDTENGIEIDLGDMDPRGRVETSVRTDRGEVLSVIPEPDDEPLSQVVKALERIGSVLPEEPVNVGDEWTHEMTQDLAFGTATSTTTWRLDRIEEVEGRRIAVLASTSTATLTDMAVPPKTLQREVDGQVVDIVVEEYIVTLTATHNTELLFDIEAGKPVGMSGTNESEMDVTQRVSVAGETVMEHGEPIHATRGGTLTMVIRPPTDEELIQALPLALSNSASRQELSLLEAFCAPNVSVGDETGFAAVEGMIEPLFEANGTIKASADDLEIRTDGDSGVVTFELTAEGAATDDAPFAPLYEGPITIDAARDGTVWRATAFR